VYSTYDGAKKRAKQLKRLFDDSGFVFTLHQAQAALARAGGFRDWHELQSVLSTSERPTDAWTFRRRLLAALPGPCHSPARAWLDGELNDTRSRPACRPGISGTSSPM
jgi:hypothetical protein